jgi:hypothetical protein
VYTVCGAVYKRICLVKHVCALRLGYRKLFSL